MARESISDVLLMHPNGPMRLLLRMALTQDGYRVTEAPTCAAVLRQLHGAATPPMVVLVGNWGYTFQAEETFFARIAEDGELAHRHCFLLLSTILDWLPAGLDARLRSLGVLALRMPFEVPDLLALVALAAGRTPAENTSAG